MPEIWPDLSDGDGRGIELIRQQNDQKEIDDRRNDLLHNLP